MIINNRVYNERENVYFIAEVGINHNGSLDIAKEIIREASLYGADAVKFQKRDPEKLWTKEYLDSPYTTDFSFGKTYGEHKSFLEFSNEEYKMLKETADKYKIDFLVSAFDIENLDFCVKELQIPAIKIPSPFITHLPYIKHASKYKLPIFLSTGMHNINEIDKAVEIFKKNKAELVLMQCTSYYPLKDKDVNLKTLKIYSKRYNCNVGYSGHDTGVIIPAIAATAFGAIVIEKHITLDRTLRGPDHAASLESRGLDLTIKYIKSALRSLGSSEKRVLEGEKKNRIKYCLSVKAKFEIKKGVEFTENNLIFKSPRLETARDYYELLGTKAEKNYRKDEDLT